MKYLVTLSNGTLITKDASSGNEAMNLVIKEDRVEYDDIETVTPDTHK